MGPGENNQLIPVQQSSDLEEEDVCELKFIIKNRLSAKPGQELGSFVFSIFSTATASTLLEVVGRKMYYHPDSFKLELLRKPKAPILIHRDLKGTLEDFGFRLHQLNVLVVSEKNDNCSAYEQENTDITSESSSTHVPPPAPPPYTPGTASSSSDYLYSCNYNSSLIKTETGFVGLVNQAMTCYLNSLLQTLYMTPEFRNALYKWEFDGTEEEGIKSIPYQLQKLFLQLQTSKKPAVGTTQLTTSFGWDSSEAWQQHDVQELCRVMFDALEQKFKHTEQADLISTLYEGKLKDYVKCLECGYESARQDTFLDVPLVVRPFGSSQAFGSVEEALHAFVTPEILCGCNQYFCDQCNKKCNAHKGLKFLKFPYMLTLQLKRFDFDPTTRNRIKLNDKVTFPEILNINDFIKEQHIEDAFDDVDTIDNGSAPDDEGLCCPPVFSKSGIPISPEGSSIADPADDDEGIDVGANVTLSPDGLNSQEISTNEKNLRKSMGEGPYVYELFSIMVHAGNTSNGHYYAYIKSFSDGEWYSFNDASVDRITYDDIRKTYGGLPTRSYYSPAAYLSSTNAYMLIYRQIDKERNVEFMSINDFPDHIKRLVQTMQEQEELERQQREMDRYMCKIKLFCQHPVQKRMVEMKLKVHKDITLAEATSTARSIMGLDSLVPLNCCRLVKYDDFHDSLECSFEGMDDAYIGEILGGVKSNYKFDLLLEIKKPENQFEEYVPGGFTVKVQVVDLKLEEVLTCRNTIRCNPNETVGGLKNQLAKILNSSANSIRVVFDVLKILENNSSSLKNEGFGKTSKIFIEYQDAEDSQKPFLQSKFYKILECYSYTICISVALPKVDRTFLKKIFNSENDTDKDDSCSEEESETPTAEKLEALRSQRNLNVCKRSKPKVRSKYESVSYFDLDFSNLVTTQSNPQSLYLTESKKLSSSVELNKKCQPIVTPDDSSQDCDEGLGDNDMAYSCLPSSYQSCQAVHSDQSEDSSLTDSERTLVGDELSPRNNSPDIMGTEIESDYDPAQSYSPPETVPSEWFDSMNSSDSNVRTEFSPECGESSSEEETCKNVKFNAQLDASLCEKSQNIVVKRYFRAWPYTDLETREKMLRVYVDKRSTFADLKRELEPFVGVEKEYFKIHRVYSSNQEFECSVLKENLMSFTDDTKLTVKLERELRKGEYKVKIYQLRINETEPIKYLMDWVLVKGMTVLQVKKEILPEIKDIWDLEIPLNRCRLRKKSWKNPGIVFLDHQRFGKDIPINTRSSNWEIFLEVLEDAEIVTSISSQLVFIKRWWPSTYEMGPLKEVVLEPANFENLEKKLSETSGIPVDYIELAKGPGTFPCEVSVMSIHNELDWFPSVSRNTWALSLVDDGLVVYYRDGREELKILTEEEKRLIATKEGTRSNRNHKPTFSPRKEKALKIYTVDDMPNKSNILCSSVKNVESRSLVVPDLD